MSASPDIAAERRAILAELRGGGGPGDPAVRALDVLYRSWPQSLEAMAGDEVLDHMLRGYPAAAVWYERRMTALRRRLLFSPAMIAAAPLLAPLAIQCHLNEYAWAEDAAETECVEGLIEGRGAVTPEQVMAVACYRPLAELPQADEWLAGGWSGPVQRVLHEQVVLVREERAIAANLPALTPIVGDVSAAVRAQYEANPYPRWRYATRAPVDTHMFGRPLPASPRVLIAGCGTGRHAIEATFARAADRILAVDLSRRSLAYALRKSRVFGIDNIDYAQADILALGGDYEEAFDVVESVGVLHHMADPYEGVRAVCRLLKPGGFLALGLYSAAARRPLRPAQELARSYRPDQVRELRQAIIDAPAGDPVRYPLGSRDFYATSGCRDLLMHVQEHQFTVADLRRMLDENGLEFLGFVQFHALKATYQAMFPHDPNGVDLGAWEAFEAAHPRTFGRMYQFWSVKRA